MYNQPFILIILTVIPILLITKWISLSQHPNGNWLSYTISIFIISIVVNRSVYVIIFLGILIILLTIQIITKTTDDIYNEMLYTERYKLEFKRMFPWKYHIQNTKLIVLGLTIVLSTYKYIHETAFFNVMIVYGFWTVYCQKFLRPTIIENINNTPSKEVSIPSKELFKVTELSWWESIWISTLTILSINSNLEILTQQCFGGCLLDYLIHGLYFTDLKFSKLWHTLPLDKKEQFLEVGVAKLGIKSANPTPDLCDFYYSEYDLTCDQKTRFRVEETVIVELDNNVKKIILKSHYKTIINSTEESFIKLVKPKAD